MRQAATDLFKGIRKLVGDSAYESYPFSYLRNYLKSFVNINTSSSQNKS